MERANRDYLSLRRRSVVYAYDLADRLTGITPQAGAGPAVTLTLDALGRHRTRAEALITATLARSALAAAEGLGGRIGNAVANAGSARSTIVLGRSMTARVIPYAEKFGYGYYRGTPKGLRWLPKGAQVALNQAWLVAKVLTRHSIKDIGESASTPLARSAFYDAEHRTLSALRYPRDERIDLHD